jgi:hypothetical protein
MRTLLPRNVPPDGRGRSMRRASGIVLLAGGLLLTAGAAPGTAQTVTPRFDDLRAEAHRGETVYVTDHAGTTVKGRVVSISATSIELLVKDGSREWRVTDVAWITQRHRHAGRGALAGLALGAVLGAITVGLDSYCQNGHYDGCGRDDAEMALFLAGLFGGIGGGVGAAIGAATRSEHVLYAAPSRPTAHVLAPIVAPGVIGMRAQLRF